LSRRHAATSTRTAGYTGSDSKPPGTAPNAQLWLKRKAERYYQARGDAR
jgi:hypothetical protein